MSPGRTTQLAYHLLKEQIVCGEWQPGARLDPAQIARRLGMSATPVRDALHQMLGERLIEAWPREGFKIPIPSEGALRELYGLNADLVATVLRNLRPRIPTRPPPTDLGQEPRALFDEIAAATNAEYGALLHQTSDRLHRARLVERYLFADHDKEHAALVAAWSSSAVADLTKLMARYHRRRQKEVAAIVAALLKPSTPI
ncbi:GntR family transcriptional regulator [Novosphingobium sp. JCM 18896]|uniref:GntR family transcriptional regulator n=1 Tax=Novosphingobium sp. JCM 18896 TaxID=2989731 RepID=UPI0022221984|nr:GntR family transcriptional regulator [Novosphingobium sp. JCM 18896]MCW1430889.1 GntR family transcriptional regulator [Novosphingobium sp. JCM 18896]